MRSGARLTIEGREQRPAKSIAVQILAARRLAASSSLCISYVTIGLYTRLVEYHERVDCILGFCQWTVMERPWLIVTRHSKYTGERRAQGQDIRVYLKFKVSGICKLIVAPVPITGGVPPDVWLPQSLRSVARLALATVAIDSVPGPRLNISDP